MDIWFNGRLIRAINGSTNVNQVVFTFSHCVKDEVRGFLTYKNTWHFVGVSQYTWHQHKPIHKLALILESPHKDEYSLDGTPLRPANGKTGTKINTRLTSRPFIVQLNQSFDYEVWIINPVQYQCSCYNLFSAMGEKCSQKITKQVFRTFFSARYCNLRQDFIDRLRIGNYDFVLNCSTSALKAVVETAIKQAVSRNSNAKDQHPSMW